MSAITNLEELNAGFGAWLKAGKTPQSKWLAKMTKTFREEEILVMAFGGCLRDLVLGREPRDLDLVVHDMMWDRVQPIVKPWLKRTNRFGGLKLEVPGVGEVDMWPDRGTHGFTSGQIGIPTVLRLPLTTSFNVEAVVLECTEVDGMRFAAENGFFAGIRSRTVDFISFPVVADEKLTAARAGAMAAKLDFRLSPRLASWCQGVVKKHGWDAVGEMGHHHYQDKSPAEIIRLLQMATEDVPRMAKPTQLAEPRQSVNEINAPAR